jgi:allantoinase
MREAGVVVRGGVIADIIRPGDVRADVSVEDCGDCIVMPGLVENHVHLKGPGRTDF